VCQHQAVRLLRKSGFAAYLDVACRNFAEGFDAAVKALNK
jgi:hypothetical protein